VYKNKGDGVLNLSIDLRNRSLTEFGGSGPTPSSVIDATSAGRPRVVPLEEGETKKKKKKKECVFPTEPKGVTLKR